MCAWFECENGGEIKNHFSGEGGDNKKMDTYCSQIVLLVLLASSFSSASTPGVRVSTIGVVIRLETSPRGYIYINNNS
jgi:hypothetical protein